MWGFCQGHHQGKVVGFLHREVEMYMKTQCLKTDKEWIHFTQTLLKEHTWECPKSKKHPTYLKPSFGRSFQTVVGREIQVAPLGASGWDGVL